MMRATSGGMAGPGGNGGAEAARVADAFREEDERRSAQLDRLIRAPVMARQFRREYPGCPECGSKAKHLPGCSQSQAARVAAELAGERREPGTYCLNCGHSVEMHRGIICHAGRTHGGRCRCSSGARTRR